MGWEDIFAEAIVGAANGDLLLLIVGLILFMVAVILAPSAIWIAREQHKFMEAFATSITASFKHQEEATTKLVEAQNKIAEDNMKAVDRMVSAVIQKVEDCHDAQMGALDRTDRHVECIKRTVIETQADVRNHVRG